MNLQSILITNARIIDPATGRDEQGDIFIDNGRFAPLPASPAPGVRCIDAGGMVVAPGLWDIHVHFRDPGASGSETLASGAAAAVAGGFTTVVTMPNTSPSCDSPEWLKYQQQSDLPVTILPSACITVGRSGTAPAELEELAAAGAAAFTDDGAMVDNDAVMAEAMRRIAPLGRVVMEHAVVPCIAGSGMIRECWLAHELDLPIFPPEAEIEAVIRDIRLSRHTGCPMHIQHISTRGAVEAIRRARAEGLAVSGEASPHHLAIAAEDIPGDDGNFRMNPPLGNRDDVEALCAAVIDGTLEVLATDHAPHTPASKSKGFRRAPFGVIGMENAIGVTYRELVLKRGMPLHDFIARWTIGPAAVMRLPLPSLAIGEKADLVLLDFKNEWTVDPSKFRSLSRNCPFNGARLIGRAVLTINRGRIVFEA
ncbi:MAG: dihydroorotase [Lentisphaerae bacterium]|nr:dihydroorotase [Lentisphaerota bacterium]